MTVNRDGERQCEWCGDPMPHAFKLAKVCSESCRAEYQRDYFKRLLQTPARREYQRAYQLARYHKKARSGATNAGVTISTERQKTRLP